jgi:hypothetical protein
VRCERGGVRTREVAGDDPEGCYVVRLAERDEQVSTNVPNKEVCDKRGCAMWLFTVELSCPGEIVVVVVIVVVIEIGLAGDVGVVGIVELIGVVVVHFDA